MPVNEGSPNFPADAASRYGLGVYGPDGNFYAFRGDPNHNLLVALGAALPAGGNVVGGIKLYDANGNPLLGSSPASLGTPVLPAVAHPAAVYMSATLSIPANNTQASLQVNLPVLTLLGTTVFDAVEATLAVANAGTSQPINLAVLGTSDSISGVNFGANYGLTNVSIASGASQVFHRTLTRGAFPAWYVICNFAAAPTAGTLAVRLLLRSRGSGTGDTFAGTQTATTTAAMLLRAPSDGYTGTELAVQSVLVQADPTNSTDIYVGTATSQPFRVQPGYAVGLAVTEINDVWVQALTGTARVNYLCEL